MKVDGNASFKKLSAGSVTDKPNISQKPKSKIDEATKANSDAAAAISKVGSAGDTPIKEADVQRSVQAASGPAVEDVTKLADLLADKIRKNPDQAISAQANQGQNKVEELLR